MEVNENKDLQESQNLLDEVDEKEIHGSITSSFPTQDPKETLEEMGDPNAVANIETTSFTAEDVKDGPVQDLRALKPNPQKGTTVKSTTRECPLNPGESGFAHDKTSVFPVEVVRITTDKSIAEDGSTAIEQKVYDKIRTKTLDGQFVYKTKNEALLSFGNLNFKESE